MKTAVMCIGNRDGGDDAVGPYIADFLSGASDLFVLDCGTVPEVFTSAMKRYHPDRVILVDATEMGLPPGTARRIPKEKIANVHVSTHNMPLSVLITYLETFVETVMLIGIQPKKMEGEMSGGVEKAACKVASAIKSETLSEISLLGEE